jgi:MOSC domain-containing protein YiiM
MKAKLLSVQAGLVRKVLIQGRLVPSAMRKVVQSGPVQLAALGLLADEQADLSVHGGLDKAVYAYPAEHYDFWRAARPEAGLDAIDTRLDFGALGENLSLQGLRDADVWVGDELHFAHCRLRVTEPREPCFKFNAAMGFSGASKLMAQSGFCGFYLAVDTPGTLSAGEECEHVPGPRRVSIAERFAAKMFKHLR